MAAIRESVLAAICLTLLNVVAAAAEPPRPPQPPLTNAALAEWNDEQSAIHDLQDNDFLHEAAVADFSAKVAAWQGADALLNMQVARVTKEAVICNPLIAGRMTIRNEQEPAAAVQERGLNNIALRVGDVVPLEVARGLRAHDTLVVRGGVASVNGQLGLVGDLAIAKAQAIAVVSRSYASDASETQYARDSRNRAELMPTPRYPAGALAAGADGRAVFQVADAKLTLTSSAGNSLLDDAAMQAMQRHGSRSWQQFPGEHQFTFRILGR
jgi:hypothetical protein